LGLTISFLLVEIFGGVIFNSLALLSDAAHMFTDVMALAIAIAAIRLSRMPADHKRTFGYHRFEILAAAFNASLLFLVAFFILYEAYLRWTHPEPVQSLGMLAVAAAGLTVNLIGMRLLAGDADKSMNVKGAYLEVWADAVGSVAVIAGGALVYFTGWTRADPVIAVLIALWVLPRTLLLFRQSVNVLLEGVPEGVDLAEIENSLLAIPGVRDVHELHVWSVGSGKTSLTAHLLIDADSTKPQAALDAAGRELKTKFGITHSTIQAEVEHCGPDGKGCALERKTPTHTAHAH
jgi:cobalt-zinc-cadmium efflux system protein